ncbi:MAG: tetratricopeptide repeat protein [Rhizobiales bacterium]|nr:tetratricopeptide repeat protein [Hyphomicrobiales bacterium]
MGLLAALPAAAQTVAPRAPSAPVTAEDAAAYDAAFQETLSNPADPPTLVKFATLAVKVGDLEGAISALDRLLLIDGDNPDVQLELGVLYFRLGSMEAAKGYLEAARTSRRASVEAKERAASFLKEASRP